MKCVIVLVWVRVRILLGLLFGYVVVDVCFFKQKTAYEMRMSDWSSDVCSSDLGYGFADSIAKLVPGTPGATLVDALEQMPELKQRYDNEEDTRARSS